jgi:hypothetical protein
MREAGREASRNLGDGKNRGWVWVGVGWVWGGREKQAYSCFCARGRARSVAGAFFSARK